MSLVKSLQPYLIDLNCLLSLYKQPPINPNWTEDDLEDYMDRQKFGLNIYRLCGNKAELSVNFPGKLEYWYHDMY